MRGTQVGYQARWLGLSSHDGLGTRVGFVSEYRTNHSDLLKFLANLFKSK